MATKIDPIGEAITRDLKELSQAHLDALAATAEAQVMLQLLLKNEAQRTERKFGTDHPRTQQQRARLQTSRTQINALMVEQEREQIQVPKVAEDEALIHGQVVDNDGRGIEGLTAHLSDQNATPIPGAGESTTDKPGYFAIILTPKLISLLQKRHETGVFLTVTDAKGGLIQRQSKPLVLDKGTILVKEIKLSRSELFRSGSANAEREVYTVAVPDVIGLLQTKALESLKAAHLDVGELKTEPDPDQAGRVLSQDPAGGTRVDVGAAVNLVIAVAEKAKVPKVVGIKLDSARRKIGKHRFTIGKISHRASPKVGVVLAQEPREGMEVPVGSSMDLVVGEKAGEN